jgi:hypothetical protein
MALRRKQEKKTAKESEIKTRRKRKPSWLQQNTTEKDTDSSYRELW